MSKFTPGKWIIDDSSMGRASRVVSEDGLIIAECWNADQEANAHLIASAPDLLEACKMFLTLVTEQQLFSGAALVKAKEAIAKAEGK